MKVPIGTLVQTKGANSVRALAIAPSLILGEGGNVVSIDEPRFKMRGREPDVEVVGIVDAVVLIETLVFPIPIALVSQGGRFTASWQRDPGVYKGMGATVPAAFRCEVSGDNHGEVMRRWWLEIMPPTQAALGAYRVVAVFYVVHESMTEADWQREKSMACAAWINAGRSTAPPLCVTDYWNALSSRAAT